MVRVRSLPHHKVTTVTIGWALPHHNEPVQEGLELISMFLGRRIIPPKHHHIHAWISPMPAHYLALLNNRPHHTTDSVWSSPQSLFPDLPGWEQVRFEPTGSHWDTCLPVFPQYRVNSWEGHLAIMSQPACLAGESLTTLPLITDKGRLFLMPVKVLLHTHWELEGLLSLLLIHRRATPLGVITIYWLGQ